LGTQTRALRRRSRVPASPSGCGAVRGGGRRLPGGGSEPGGL